MDDVNVREVLSLLRSPDGRKRKEGWKIVEEMKEGNVLPLIRNRLYLRSLLWNPLEGVREDAWNHIDVYVSLNVKGVERTMKARSDTIKWSAWKRVHELVGLGLIDWVFVYSVRDSFWRLLKSRYPTIRKKAWRLFQELMKEGIFTERDKERYVSLLKSEKASVRIIAWKVALSTGFFKRDELRDMTQYLTELTKEDSKVKIEAKRIMQELS
ncbi:hypothetical protein IC007_1421 [Sulfuracidifex tepidarius]|uniref:DNA alkylation repair enzyme n=1 Tax=Sulfuracidifex tepidarius TaxID=1294262 RepID=A0A510E4B6_9CREN|nr:hypothetical protein IC007_1421 [Sulfuracidifex tepidarius]